MLNILLFDDIAGTPATIEIDNPALVARVRRAASTLSPNATAAHLADAITAAADAAHAREWQKAEFGAANPDAIVESEYYGEIAAAWSLIAVESQLADIEILAHSGSAR